MATEHTDEAGAYKEIPSITRYEDIGKLRAPHYEIDRAETEHAVERAREMTGGALPVVVRTDEMHWGPFEYAVRLRGIENLLFDVRDAPEFVHRLMGTITAGFISYQEEREAAGGVSTAVSGFGHVPYDEAPESLRKRLKGMWAYIHAQSAASLSPEMYAEFVHPLQLPAGGTCRQGVLPRLRGPVAQMPHDKDAAESEAFPYIAVDASGAGDKRAGEGLRVRDALAPDELGFRRGARGHSE